MLIGKDFDKIEFELFGLELLEPNAFIGDMLIFILSIYFAIKTKEQLSKGPFFQYWYWFYIVFGAGFFLGGIGHAFYNYIGMIGKHPSWFLGIISVAFIEWAMASIHPNTRFQKHYKKIIFLKLALAITIEILVIGFGNLEKALSIGLIVPTLNSVIGLSFALGVLGFKYQKSIYPSFIYLWISALVQVPSAIIQGMKINIYPWLDRNDISHILLILGCSFYYLTIKGYAKHLSAREISVS